MNILIGADFVPTRSNFDLFRTGNGSELFGDELLEIFQNSDFRIFNLETPLTDRLDPIPKWGPNLSAPAACINGYKAAGVDLVTLANNHIMDQHIAGFQDTLDILEKNGIAYTGAGQNLDEAHKPYLFEFAGKKVGVYTCAEHEFSIAGENQPGANPFDPLYSLDHVAELKHKTDYVIVLYHGGKEHYRYPSPRLQQVCRRLIDKGADLVICQHSHCIGCEEKYKLGTIVYGQGNFLFDGHDNEYWNTGLLIQIDDRFSISYIPLEKKENAVRLAEAIKSEEILNGFNLRSEEIIVPGFIEKKYSEFANNFINYYFRAFSGKWSLIYRAINKITNGRFQEIYLEKKYGRLEKLRLSNYIDCEAHRELLSEILIKK